MEDIWRKRMDVVIAKRDAHVPSKEDYENVGVVVHSMGPEAEASEPYLSPYEEFVQYAEGLIRELSD